MQIYRFYVLSASSDPDNYRYVGVTSRTSVNQRFYGHKYCAMHDNKRVLPVHKWMYKHYQNGEDILIKEIYTCDESIWKTEEYRLIKEYHNAGYDLLNLQEGGEGVITKEMRDTDGITRSAEAHKKAIVAIDPKTMEVAHSFNSIKEANAFFGITKKSTAISNALNQNKNCKNYIKSHGYYWLFKEDYDDNGTSSIDTTHIPRVNQKTIYQFDLNGNFLKSYNNIAEMARKKIASENGVKSAINNRKIYRNSVWSYSDKININEYKIYSFEEIDKNGNVIEKYVTLKDICNKYGKSVTYWSVFISNDNILENGNKIIKIKI